MDYSLGTWNVKTLNKPGAMKSVLKRRIKSRRNPRQTGEINMEGDGIEIVEDFMY
jgi:hypothetical protein